GQPLQLFLRRIFGRSALLASNPPLGQQLLRQESCLDRLSELDLFLSRQQRCPRDLLEIENDAVLAVDTVVRRADTSHASHRNSLRRYMESNARVRFKIPRRVCKHPEGSLRVPGTIAAWKPMSRSRSCPLPGRFCVRASEF